MKIYLHNKNQFPGIGFSFLKDLSSWSNKKRLSRMVDLHVLEFGTTVSSWQIFMADKIHFLTILKIRWNFLRVSLGLSKDLKIIRK